VSPDLAQKLIVAGLAFAALGLWLAVSQRTAALRLVAAAGSALGMLAVVAALDGPGGDLADQALFWLFAGGAILGGVLMITGRDPVHGALWFAVATLCVCGLFLELSAPFLAAATVIVYAGAIIVTFMFVIMLAAQGGATAYDQRPRLPVTSFFVLGALMFALLDWQQRPQFDSADEGPTLAAAMGAVDPDADGVAEEVPVTPQQAATLQTLGRTLFGHYLFAVELGGTLLLIATIGAIALAPRRQRGNL
jgi:NADH-quinone oxidoreductase subunit J